MLMIILVNALNCWKFFDVAGKAMQAAYLAGKKVQPQQHFFSKLCNELFNNPYLKSGEKQCSQGEGCAPANTSPSTAGTPSQGRNSNVGSAPTPRNIHVPVNTAGQSNISGASVSEIMQHHCTPQPLPKGVQAKCGVPGCKSVTVTKGQVTEAPFKTSVKCGRCHLVTHDNRAVPAFICNPLSGRTCWFQHVAHAREHGHAHVPKCRKIFCKTENYSELSEEQQQQMVGVRPVQKRKRGRPTGSSKKQKIANAD
ncbi:hypothetical protein CYMTET_37128 [Cymbomonas tetramitiformis]|uniref:Uncharacterized protein n=1 Tax=Cymbomonas tetramitiformis TaxID=36881 RepID=A0AAE0BPD8_9CHLO|nr:hypothetical protein CYMTET_49857 [Cymbomonas tetramitiformis]KAK3253630.1 hypothetical protein CYMTET_37128 [Cymbomonas tetramitiformis]